MNYEDDTLIDPPQLSDPTAMEPYLSVQLCLAGRPILQLRHFHIKPLGLDASPELTWGPSSPLGSSLVFWLTAHPPHPAILQLCALTASLPSSTSTPALYAALE